MQPNSVSRLAYKFDRLRFDRSADRLSRRVSKIRDRLHKLLCPSSEPRASSSLRYWERHPLWYSLTQELRSFLGHIETMCEMRLYRRGADLGPAFERLPNGSLVPCRETQSRISSTKMLDARFPWSSAVDLQIFLLGWDTASETLQRNFYSDTQSQGSFIAPVSPLARCHCHCNNASISPVADDANSLTPSTPTPSPSLPQPSQESPSESNAPGRNCSARSVAQEPPSD